MVHTIKFVLKNTNFINFNTKTVLSIISKIFDKICFVPPTLRVAFTPSTSTIADKKKFESNIFLKTT